MKQINTRFSYEKRVKLILISFIAAAAVFFILCVPVYSESVSEDLPAGRMNLIRTSGNSESYSVIEANGNTITARGKYTSDRIRKLVIYQYISEKNAYAEYKDSGTYSMNAHKDGSYEAEISLAVPAGQYQVVLKFDSGAIMRYLIFYGENRGWYFPDNGLGEKNRSVFEHIYEAPAEAAAIYLSSSADPEEVQSTLEQIRLLAERTVGDEQDTYRKARLISEFVAASVYYDVDARDTQVDAETISLHHVLHTSRTVCAGFSNLFCAMCEAVGIDAVNIKGGVTTGDVKYADLCDGVQNHEFAAFYYEPEERWVWADACWDGNSTYEKGEFKKGLTKEMYFDISDDALAFNHRADKAERRRYFEAKTAVLPLGVQTDENGETVAVITSDEAEEVTETSDTADVPSDTTLPAEETTGGKDKPLMPAEAEDNTILTVIIAVLAAAVIAAAAAVIIITKNGRKNSKW